MIHPTAPAYSIGKSSLKAIDQLDGFEHSSPGPKYNTEINFGDLPNKRQTIGTQRRKGLIFQLEITPSPCDYNPIKLHPSSIKHSIPQGRKDQQAANGNPDPGWYNPQHQRIKPKLLSYSIGSKYESVLNDNRGLPGPCDYIINKDKNQTILNNKLFGTANRFSQSKLLPGPGDYSIANEMTAHRQSIGKAHRMSKPQLTPGPTDYSKPSQFSSFKKKQSEQQRKQMANKQRFGDQFISQKETITAYNKYFQDPKTTLIAKRKAPSYSVGRSSRDLWNNRNYPGPTDYDTRHERKEQVKVTFAKAQRININANGSPGPDAYFIENKIDALTNQSLLGALSTLGKQKKDKFTFARSKSMNNLVNNPGVGDYELNKHNANKGISIPKSARTNFISSNIAGVGDYEIMKKVIGNVSMPKAQRFPKNKKHIPGPGDYHVQSTISNLHFYNKATLK